MNLDKLNEMWEQDSQLNDEKLDHDSLAIPKLHAKYLRLYNTFNTLKDQQEFEVKRTYRDRWEYYTGKAEKPFPIKLIKTDVPTYLEADEVYAKSVLKLKYYNQMVDALKAILQAINNRSFYIKNAIEFAKFLTSLVASLVHLLFLNYEMSFILVFAAGVVAMLLHIAIYYVVFGRVHERFKLLLNDKH